MKLLIAYDGSDCANAALDELRHAGLPDACDATILSVVELAPTADEPRELLATYEGYHEMRELAASAEARLRLEFPTWRVRTHILRGVANTAIPKQAELEEPDLLVMGCHGRSNLVQFYLGSVTRAVLERMPCSVRIGRRAKACGQEPLRLLVGFNDSSHARAAVDAVTARKWPAGAQVRIVNVLETDIALVGGDKELREGDGLRMSDYQEIRNEALEPLLDVSKKLDGAGLSSTSLLRDGEASHALLEEAYQSSADCIFVGAGHWAAADPCRLGEVAAHIAMRAPCSVEIILSESEWET
jgi:nucleotide-binding universal stress UspA family protein